MGQTLHVTTRRFDSDFGLKFTAELDREIIEVTKCDCEIGTTIKIEVDDSKRAEVEAMFNKSSNDTKKWDWYCNKHPRLLRLAKTGEEIDPEFIFEKDNKWVSTQVDGYSEVLWSHRPKRVTGYRYSKTSALYCNGIFISDSGGYKNSDNVISDDVLSADIRLSTPTILVTDKDGRLPVKLQRDGLTEFDKTLSESVRISLARDLIAEAIAIAPDHSPFTEIGQKQLMSRDLTCSIRNHSFNQYRSRTHHWCWEDGGWRLADRSLSTKKPLLLAIYQEFDLSFFEDKSQLLEDVSLVWQQLGVSMSNFAQLKIFFRSFAVSEIWKRSERFYEPNYQLPFHLTFSETVLKKLKSGNTPIYLSNLLDNGVGEFGEAKYLSTMKEEYPILDVLETCPSKQKIPNFGFALVGGKNSVEQKEGHILPSLWQELMGDKPIPVRYDDRHTAFPIAFEQLENRIAFHRERLKAGK